MVSKTESLGFQPPHPGEYLREDILPALGMTASAFARHLGVSKQTVSELLAEKRAISTDMAIRLGIALRNGARFWLAMQLQHDLWIEERQKTFRIEPLNWNADAA